MRYAILILGLVIMAMLVMEFNSRTTDLNRLLAERDVVKAELDQKSHRKAELEAKLEYASSDAAVVRWAHLFGHMVRDGDVRVVPIAEKGFIPTPTPIPEINEPESAEMNGWLALFVGHPTP